MSSRAGYDFPVSLWLMILSLRMSHNESEKACQQTVGRIEQQIILPELHTEVLSPGLALQLTTLE